jgi:hypothetical protein
MSFPLMTLNDSPLMLLVGPPITWEIFGYLKLLALIFAVFIFLYVGVFRPARLILGKRSLRDVVFRRKPP